MKLLTLIEAKDESTANEEHRRERIRQLNQAESESVARLNSAREAERKEHERRNREADEFTAALAAKIEPLRKEVASLESRAKDARRPVVELLKEAERKRAEADARLTDAEERERKASERERTADATLHRADEMIAEASETLSDAESRMQGAKQEEETLTLSQKRLSEAWEKHWQGVDAANAALLSREQAVREAERALEGRQQSLKKLEIDLGKEKRAIQDGYESLARARKEILGREE